MAPLLPDRVPLSWADMQAAAHAARVHAVDELVAHWPAWAERSGDPLLWGDEVEAVVIAFDDGRRRAPLSLAQDRVLAALEAQARAAAADAKFPSFQPEYARYMVESSPGHPYEASPAGLCEAEASMRLRRKLIQACLTHRERVMTLATYPLLGLQLPAAPGTATNAEHIAFDGIDWAPLHGPILRSSFLPDEVISPFHRYRTLTANTRNRKGGKPGVHVPLFMDTFTPDRWKPHPDENPSHASYGRAIYMDALPFGTGCCGLQATIQASCLAQAREMHDLLVPLSPILLALTAASPAFRGALADVDSRWSVLVQACDDRTEDELLLAERAHHQSSSSSHPSSAAEGRGSPAPVDPKSRWDMVNMYLALPPQLAKKQAYHPHQPILIHQASYNKLIQSGMEPLLARHFAHILHHDPLLLYPDASTAASAPSEEGSTEYLDRFLTTTWPAVRLKPPLSPDGPGWRVEVRSMEVQLTDFENAAFTTFAVLLVKVLLELGYDAHMPLAAVDLNMASAQRRDAVKSAKFLFSTHFARCLGAGSTRGGTEAKAEAEAETEDLSVFSLDELINGQPDGFQGLVPLLRGYLSRQPHSAAHAAQLDSYLDLISRRASGACVTLASYMRRYITHHRAYRGDSQISPEVAYDLLTHLAHVEQGTVPAPDLLPTSYAPLGDPPAAQEQPQVQPPPPLLQHAHAPREEAKL